MIQRVRGPSLKSFRLVAGSSVHPERIEMWWVSEMKRFMLMIDQLKMMCVCFTGSHADSELVRRFHRV